MGRQGWVPLMGLMDLGGCRRICPDLKAKKELLRGLGHEMREALAKPLLSLGKFQGHCHLRGISGTVNFIAKGTEWLVRGS